MENATLGMDTSTAADPRARSDCNLAFLRRRAWAKSRDSIWQEQEPNNGGPQGPQQNQSDGETQRTSEEIGQVPNKITSWLIECRTPLGASLDDQSASPNKGAQRNGCSFEDDLSLGAEANFLQSSNNKSQPCFGLAADQKRSRFKEGGRSMNSTGSGKSSTVSSVSELLDLYEEDPEEILLNLGFGREEPDLPSRVPSRFINNGSSARGIDIKVYLGAQMQRMELENPNYALTSRFRQIEVLTTVANEFFQLYSQVSGQPVQRISMEQGGEGAEEKAKDHTLPKRSNSALNIAKRLKKTISKHNLIAATAAEASEPHVPKQQTQLNGNSSSDHTNTNGHALNSPEQDGGSSDLDQKAETVNLKHNRKKDSCSLATVTEETNGDGEAEESPKRRVTEQAANGEPQPESDDSPSTNEAKNEETPAVREAEEEKNLTSTLEKASPYLVPPQLAQLHTENADSFDIEEIQSNEDEAAPHRTSRATDLLRTVSQPSDSSGFAEEPSVDSNTNLKVQESIDSCDSETTVTSYPSQDVATPIALDHTVFELPDGTEEEMKPGEAAPEAQEMTKSQEEEEKEEEEYDGTSGQIPQYTSHNFLKSTPMGMQQDETPEEEQMDSRDRTEPEAEITQCISTSEHEPESEMTQSSASEHEPQLDLQHIQDQSASDQNPEITATEIETSLGTEPPAEGVAAEGGAEEKQVLLDAPSSSVISALRRAKLSQLGRTGQSNDASQIPQRGRGRGRGRGGIRLQRSSSLPSSFLSASRVVSSVKIQFGRGQVSCSQPTYSFKYTQEAGEGEEEENDEVEEQTNCLSTLIINPGSRNQPKPPTEAPITPKPVPPRPIPPNPIPQYLMQSTRSLQNSSPLSDWLPESYAHSWSTQSVPELTSSRSQVNHFPQNIEHQNQQSWNPGQNMSPYPNPAVQYLNPSPNPSPSLNLGSYPFGMYPPLQYPSPFQPYASPPNLHRCHNSSLIHHSSLTSLYRPKIPTIPLHASLSNLHHPPTSTNPHHFSMGNLRPGTPLMHHQSYNPLYNHPSPYHAGPHGMQHASTYLDFHGYNTSPNLGFPHPAAQFPPLAPELSLHQGLHPTAPGFLQGLDSSFSSGQSFQHSHSPPVLSSTEMQLRRVLHDIRGTVQSLSQNQADTPDMFSEHKAALPSPQSLSEFQLKRQSLNLFRNQMADLELSITRQQALVYKHLSPADRLEVEHLQSLRSAVREELQELEQQLEDRLQDFTHQTRYDGLNGGNSMDSISTASALRAMEPVSDLLREQLFLQSEITYGDHPLSTNASTPSSSPARGEGGAHEQKQSMYRASINITPAAPHRPNTGNEGEEGEKDNVGGGGEKDHVGAAGGGENTEVDGAAGGVGTENLQDLIRQIRESVAQEVRREIYSELLATASPRKTPLPSGQQPL